MAGKIVGGEVEILEVQGSHMMKSLVDANCLIENPVGTLEINKGDAVKVAFLPS